jgi:predicted branched-subunit amino acid permease
VTGGQEGRRDALIAGMSEAIGLPALVLGASYVGFGSLVQESGLALWLGLVSTASGWALPGQVIVVELYGVGASVLAVALAVGLANARLMPMALALMPLLRRPGDAPWRYYVAGHLVAVTGWAAAMLRCPAMPRDLRLPWFVGFALALWFVSLAGTAAGYLLAGLMPEPVTLGLVFLNPLYFMLLFAGDLRRRSRAWALVAGTVLGPLLHMLDPDWGLLETGFAAGTFAFVATRAGHGRTSDR